MSFLLPEYGIVAFTLGAIQLFCPAVLFPLESPLPRFIDSADPPRFLVRAATSRAKSALRKQLVSRDPPEDPHFADHDFPPTFFSRSGHMPRGLSSHAMEFHVCFGGAPCAPISSFRGTDLPVLTVDRISKCSFSRRRCIFPLLLLLIFFRPPLFPSPAARTFPVLYDPEKADFSCSFGASCVLHFLPPLAR